MDSEQGKDATDISKKPLFRTLNPEDDEMESSTIESLCMNCEEQGTTRLMLTKVPFFKELIIMSFECPHCGYRNNEVQPGAKIQELGIRIQLKIKGEEDMNRKIVKQASASFNIPELGFEAPAFTQKGVLTTIEGLLQNAIDGLLQAQPLRQAIDPSLADKIDNFVERLKKYKSGDTNFTLLVEDIAGNSFIQNRHAPKDDPEMQVKYFERSKEENEKLGLYEQNDDTEDADTEENDAEGKDNSETNESKTSESNSVLDLRQEVLEFAGSCQNCQSPTTTNMKVIAIPHFKEVVIMASNCDACGTRSNEVKSGGGVEPLGTRITFKMTDVRDLNRDVLKSETCNMEIPDIDFELHAGTLGGRFTTLEGLFVNIRDQLKSVNPFYMGDSNAEQDQKKMKSFLEKMDKIITGEIMVTIILDDPIGNSYLQNSYAPDEDPELKIEKYERTEEQNDELGLSDMKVENYT